MLKEERHQLILNEARLHNKVLLSDLSDMLSVSVDTVRRDVKELDYQKKLKKVHGGAISLGFNIYNYKEQDIYSHKKKAQIAAKAVELIPDGSVVLIGGGTTNLEIARILPNKLHATFFTPSLPVAMQLLSHPQIEVVFVGGKLLKDSQIAAGAQTINSLEEIRADICFLTANSIDLHNGITDIDWDIVQMKKAMIKASKKVISPVISEKLASTQRYRICKINDIDVLITELDPTSGVLDAYRNEDIRLL